jgi:hypothetical protein
MEYIAHGIRQDQFQVLWIMDDLARMNWHTSSLASSAVQVNTEEVVSYDTVNTSWYDL